METNDKSGVIITPDGGIGFVEMPPADIIEGLKQMADRESAFFVQGRLQRPSTRRQ